MVTGLFEVCAAVGVHGICGVVRVKTWGYKGIKMGISFLREAQFIRMAGIGSGLEVHTGCEGWQG